MKLSSVLILLAIVVVVGAVGLAWLGIINIGPLNRQNLTKVVDEGLDAAQGFKEAKTPAEATDQFRLAIQKRNYRIAAKYVSKDYAAALERVQGPASELSGLVDALWEYAKEKGLFTDRTILALNKLDPFPKNFKVVKMVEKKGESITFATFEWEPLGFKDAKDLPNIKQQVEADLDPKMVNVLSLPVSTSNLVKGGVEVFKDGEDWKLNVPITPEWNTQVTYFNDRYRTYVTELRSFRTAMDNDRYTTPSTFENELMRLLRDAKPK